MNCGFTAPDHVIDNNADGANSKCSRRQVLMSFTVASSVSPCDILKCNI